MQVAVQKIDETTVRHVDSEGGHPHTVITLPSGRTFAYGRNPHPGVNNEPAVYAKAAVDIVEAAEKVAQASGGAIDLEYSRNAMSEMRALTEKLDSYGASLEREEAAMYAPPRADAIEAIEDMEIRNYARTLSGEHRARFMEAVGSDPRLILTFARDPLRSPGFHQFATAKWRERVAREKQDALAGLGRRKEGVEWARILLGSATRLLSGTPTKQ